MQASKHALAPAFQVNAEVDDMYKEFQREKEDLLESIRMLQVLHYPCAVLAVCTA